MQNKPEIVFGHIDGVKEGDTFENKLALKNAGIHYNHQVGIAGREADGACSIALSGEYVDDLDLDDEIIYTGQGARDKKGNVVENQTLTGVNKALEKSYLEGFPVRVSSKNVKGIFVYRGIYRIDSFWESVSKTGFLIYQYRLFKIKENVVNPSDDLGNGPTTSRSEVTVQRIIRNSRHSVEVKEIYGYCCQVCEKKLELPDKSLYAEGAHIRALGRPHNGPDIVSNILCLCPNHHVMFDNHSITVNDDFSINDISGEYDGKKLLQKKDRHRIGVEYLQYHRKLKDKSLDK